MADERIQKLLARAGLASRREAETWIAAGRVTRNGVACQLGDRADPLRDRIAVDGRAVPVRPAPNGRAIIAVHKPFGYVTTLSDPEGRRTVKDLLPPGRRLVPIGRLDLATEGLLLCTDDGDLVQAVAHPRSGVHKIYRAWVDRPVASDETRRLLVGVNLEDGPARALSVHVLDPERGEAGFLLDPQRHVRDAGAVLELVMAEGRRREVRRLVEALGLRVRRLVRIAVGPVRLTGLPPGRYRYLTEAEIGRLAGPEAGESGPTRPDHTRQAAVIARKDRPPVRAERTPSTQAPPRSGPDRRVPDRSHAKGGANT